MGLALVILCVVFSSLQLNLLLSFWRNRLSEKGVWSPERRPNTNDCCADRGLMVAVALDLLDQQDRVVLADSRREVGDRDVVDPNLVALRQHASGVQSGLNGPIPVESVTLDLARQLTHAHIDVPFGHEKLLLSLEKVGGRIPATTSVEETKAVSRTA